ncbi:MAG: arginyl-tRNA synthetase [Thermoleophilaceae bacterium]|nr:arginyl-tRNA synthetase [Thermoleophilaceae bacterium]
MTSSSIDLYTNHPKAALRAEIQAAAAALTGARSPGEPKLDRPPKPEFGDYSSNVAMLTAPLLGEPPRQVAERIGEALRERLGDALERVEVAGPGFLNLFMSDVWFRRTLAGAREAGDRFGSGTHRVMEKVLVEFVSANPTGPAHVATGRHAAYGDSLCRILEFLGNLVEREYYVNDHGSQVRNFGASIRARARGEEPPEDGYKGDYVTELAARIPGAAEADPEELARRGVEEMVAAMKATLERFGVTMDRFYSERTLYETDKVNKVIAMLEEREQVYPSEGAVWLRTTTHGDDKDRVLMRSDGEFTYFASDIAYHQDKLARGYDRVIDVWGADHHGYVGRVLAAWEALGGEPGRLELLIMQLVNLLDRGQRAQMSKRQGEFVTLDDLIDDIGVDAARWFLLQRSHDTTLDLDLALAREQSRDNPVYYVQYMHARIASIMRELGEERVAAAAGADLSAGDRPDLQPAERVLLERLIEFPDEIAEAGARRAPHRVTSYALDTAREFSRFYEKCSVKNAAEEGGDFDFRVALSLQAQTVIATSLGLLGVSAPEQM